MNNQLTKYTALLKARKIKPEQYNDLMKNVTKTLYYWTGNTLIGEPKDKIVEKRFQTFFEKLYDFFSECKVSDNLFLQDIANKVLYQGTLYRYLGHGSNRVDEKCQIKPKFKNIYVSWSKNPQNSYIESKLHGPVTWLECKVEGDFYGIDLTVFGASRANEEEVVFPTIEKTIVSIKYL